MQKIRASELFNNFNNIDSIEFEHTNNIDIDFSNIRSIDLNAINMLLNMQKVAVLNNKTLSISNVNPSVLQTLEITGLDKNFSQKTVSVKV